MGEIIDSLPDLILLEKYKGDWQAYIDAVYQYFHQDFVKEPPLFENMPVFVRNENNEKFWHLVSAGKEESERLPDIRRCERILWPRALIEGSDHRELNIWESYRPWKGRKDLRIMIGLKDFSYIVILGKAGKRYSLITAYPVEKQKQREKFKREFEAFSSQKKEGSAL